MWVVCAIGWLWNETSPSKLPSQLISVISTSGLRGNAIDGKHRVFASVIFMCFGLGYRADGEPQDVSVRSIGQP